jgi:uncharacterized protein DUF3437
VFCDCTVALTPEEAEKYRRRLSKRRAGVLGLAALVLSQPYDVPAWMPPVVVKLARHIGDPPGIAGTVRKTVRTGTFLPLPGQEHMILLCSTCCE